MDWSTGTWTHPPVAAVPDGDDLVVTAAQGSDAWRITSYGFVHDTEHALLAPLPRDSAVEVEFTIDLTEQFDQVGVFLRVSDEVWTKAGIEFADGTPNLGAVVTDGVSDWSSAPVPHWQGRRATIRASRSGDAVTIRARVDDGPLRFVRLLPLSPDADVAAGPYVCSPMSPGLVVRFHRWEVGPADASLH